MKGLNTLVYSIANYRLHVPAYVVGMLDRLFSKNEKSERKKENTHTHTHMCRHRHTQSTSIFKITNLCRLLSPSFERRMLEGNNTGIKEN